MNHASLALRLEALGLASGGASWNPIMRNSVSLALQDGPDWPLTAEDIAAAAKRLGGTAAQVWAVYDSESSGSPFIGGRPTILFEPHRFSRATAHRYDASHPHISSRSWNRKLYPGTQAGRYAQLLDAVAIDVDAGFASASYGGFQILGENFALCGAPSPWSFAWRQAQTEGDQLEAFVGFVEGRGLKGAFQQISDEPITCRPFARGFNGTAFDENHYDEHIAAAHKRRRLGA